MATPYLIGHVLHLVIETADEEVLIKIPVFVGEQQWGFYSSTRHHSFLAKFIDKDWLREFQEGKKGELSPGDSLLATIKYEVMIDKISRKKTFGKHSVKKVKKIIKKDSDLL